LLHGTNTDGEASLKVFKDKFGIIKDKSVLILGLGGAGKAVSSYFSATFKNTVVISRHESGEQFANKIGSEWASWNGVEKLVSNADIIINCTSLGFEGQELKSPLNIQQISKIRKSTIVFDIIYQPIKTKLLKMAEAKGITIINGLEMNLEQAVIAFKYCNNGSSEKIRALMKVVS
jgi:shikimate dehydrogenase